MSIIQIFHLFNLAKLFNRKLFIKKLLYEWSMQCDCCSQNIFNNFKIAEMQLFIC